MKKIIGDCSIASAVQKSTAETQRSQRYPNKFLRVLCVLGVSAVKITCGIARNTAIAILSAIVFVLFCTTQSTTFAAARAPIDPRVIADTANGATANFLIILRSQVNTRARVANIVDRNARGVAAFDALRATANTTQPALIAQLDARGVRYRAYWIVNVIAAEGDRAVVDAIANRADVLAIESNRAFHVELPKPEAILETRSPRAVEWNVTKINAPALWANGFTGQNIIYANADTGIQWDHPALVPHYAGWNGVSANHNYAWWDAIHSDISGNGTNPCGFKTLAPCDDHGHGTHTTGTGVGDDGAGNQIGRASCRERV